MEQGLSWYLFPTITLDLPPYLACLADPHWEKMFLVRQGLEVLGWGGTQLGGPLLPSERQLRRDL